MSNKRLLSNDESESLGRGVIEKMLPQFVATADNAGQHTPDDIRKRAEEIAREPGYRLIGPQRSYPQAYLDPR